MPFKLTFNKPAVRQFIQGEEAGGLRIKIQDGVVMFMPVTDTTKADSAKLSPRTRGGYEAIVDGSEADNVLKHLKNRAGPFFILRRVSKDWVVAEPYNGRKDPPKFEPHVRVWSPALKADKAVNKPTTKRAAPAVAKVTTPTSMSALDQIASINWAYEKLAEPPHPGRPDKETIEARAIRDSFEGTELSTIISAYDTLGNHLRKVCPSAVHGSDERPANERAAKQQRVQVREDQSFAPTPRGHRPLAAKTVINEVSKSADDVESEAQVRQALQKLGLEEQTAPATRRRKARGGFAAAA